MLRCSPTSGSDHARVSDVRDLLFKTLEAAGYPIREIETLSESDDQVELAPVLVPTTADAAALEAVVAALERSPAIESATWTVSAAA